MATGFPAIPTPNRIDLRAIQAAIQGARQRIEALEAQLGIVSSTAQQTSSTSTSNLNSILAQLSNLTRRVIALEQAATTDIGQFVAGESLVIGQGVVPITSTTIGAVDPSDPTRIFGLIGIALNSATPGTAVQVQRRGILTLPGVTGLVAGRAVYVDGVSVTQTPDYDATAIPVGVAVSTTQIFISPDWPALLYPTFSSGFVDHYLDYLPVTFRALKDGSSLEAMIDNLPFNSGVDSHAQVPMTVNGVAVRVNAGDIGGGSAPANLEALIDALPFNSGAEKAMMVPVTISGIAVRVTAGDIAALGGAGGGTAATLNFTTDGTLAANSDILLPTEQAVKTYVDTAINARTWKQEARARTTAALPSNTYSNGVSGVGATLTATSNGALAAQDGVTLVLSDALLVVNEPTGANNGIYVLTQVGTGLLPYILTRRIDADSGAELVDAIVPTSEGTLYANKAWENTTPAPITVGTTAIAWATLTPSAGLAYTFSTSAPGSPNVGDFWFKSDVGVKFTYVNDSNSSQWVEC